MSNASPDRPLSIAIVTGSMSRLAGGLFNSVRRSALALHELGHSVSVLALQDQHSADDLAAWAPLVPLVAARKGPAALGYAPAIGNALEAGQFDIVHQHGIWQGFSAQVSTWRRKTGGPVMISPRGMLDPWALANSAWKKRLTGSLYEKANLAKASCLHALNPSEAQSMRGFGLANPIAIIPNGADIPADRNCAAPAWWPDGKVLLFIGRIHPKKGVTELVEAFAKAAVKGWKLVIAGWDDGGHIEGLRAAIAMHGMQDSIILPGPLYDAEKDAALRHASAFILPSYSEGLPMSVLEAWAYRLPVLMSAECNLPEGFSRNAALQINQDPAQLAKQLALLLGPPLDGMGEKGRKLVEERYSWQQIARDHVQVYRWMAGLRTDMPDCVAMTGVEAA